MKCNDLTTQNPFKVWIAIAKEARIPKIDYPPVRACKLSGDSFAQGIETHENDGVVIKV